MTDFLGVLAIAGVLATASVSSVAMAQTGDGAPDAQAAGGQAESPAPSSDAAPASAPTPVATPAPATDTSAAPAGTPTPVPAPAASVTPIAPEDVKQALVQIRASWRNYEKCTHTKVCSDYFESFGVGLTFNDGTLVPFSHERRLTASPHDCIEKAHEALDKGDKALAVQWVMATQVQEPLDRNWLGDHPDAVIEALRQCCG